MTEHELRRRDRRILADYLADDLTRDIGARHGVSARHVANIAARHGVSRPKGRPRALPDAAEPQWQQFRLYRKQYGATMALEMVGAS